MLFAIRIMNRNVNKFISLVVFLFGLGMLVYSDVSFNAAFVGLRSVSGPSFSFFLSMFLLLLSFLFFVDTATIEDRIRTNFNELILEKESKRVKKSLVHYGRLLLVESDQIPDKLNKDHLKKIEYELGKVSYIMKNFGKLPEDEKKEFAKTYHLHNLILNGKSIFATDAPFYNRVFHSVRRGDFRYLFDSNGRFMYVARHDRKNVLDGAYKTH